MKKQVLSDHVRHRKKLKPPLIAATGGISKVSWVETGIPETIWIALCHHSLGERSGVRAAEVFADMLFEIAPDKSKMVAVTASAVFSLPASLKEDLRLELLDKGLLFELQRALRPLVQLYPASPFDWLFTQESAEASSRSTVDSFGRLLADLMDKTGRSAVFTLTTMVHIAFRSGMLHVNQGLTLADYPEVEDYPHTEKSRLVAASVRATANLLLGPLTQSTDESWPKRFWNRGLGLEKCSYRPEISPVPYYAGQSDY